jgi:DNA-directed RNA polymerase subunit RPC12/RpoP
MPEAISFNCPKCGSSLTPNRTAKKVKCEYCGSLVIVPEELRDNDDSYVDWDEPQSPEHQQKAHEVAEKELLAIRRKPPTEEEIKDLQEIFENVEMERLNEIEGLLAGLKKRPVRGRDYDELMRKISEIIEK